MIRSNNTLSPSANQRLTAESKTITVRADRTVFNDKHTSFREKEGERKRGVMGRKQRKEKSEETAARQTIKSEKSERQITQTERLIVHTSEKHR